MSLDFTKSIWFIEWCVFYKMKYILMMYNDIALVLPFGPGFFHSIWLQRRNVVCVYVYVYIYIYTVRHTHLSNLKYYYLIILKHTSTYIHIYIYIYSYSYRRTIFMTYPTVAAALFVNSPCIGCFHSWATSSHSQRWILAFLATGHRIRWKNGGFNGKIHYKWRIMEV